MRSVIPSDPLAPPVASTSKRLARWARQGHVLLAISMWCKLMWFERQLDEPFLPMSYLISTAGAVIVLVTWLPWVQARRRFKAAIAIDLLVSLVILADLLYFRFFSSLITVSLFPQLGQTDDVSASILALLRWTDLWLFADVLVVIAVGIPLGAAQMMARIEPFNSARTRELTSFSVVLAAVMVVAPILSQSRPGGFMQIAPYQATGLLGFHFYDAATYASDALGEDEATEEEVTLVRDRLRATSTDLDLPGAPPPGVAAGANVLLVQIESMQGVVVDRQVEGVEVTPNLNALAKEEIYFSSAYHQVGAGHTSDAEWLTGCSLYPAESGTAYFRFASNDVRCLPEVLREKGYTTSVHHANTPSFWNRSVIYPNLGYDRFYSSHDFSDGEVIGWGLADTQFFIETVADLRGADQPFYDLSITLSSHHPYDEERLQDRLDAGPLSDTILGNYLNAINYTDESLGALVDALKSEGLWDSTVVVFYGDHDSGIQDRELFEELLGTSLSEGQFGQLAAQIPMVVHIPKMNGSVDGMTVDQPVGQIDVAPMIARLLGLSAEDGATFLGSDPFSRRTRPVVLRSGGFVTDRHFVTQRGGTCYDRQSGAEVPEPECADERQLAESDLKVSDLLNEYDLLARVQPDMVSTLRIRDDAPLASVGAPHR